MGRDTVAQPRDTSLPLLDAEMSVTLVGTLASFFRDHPDMWIDGRELALVGGAYAWRTRLSDLRRPPFVMVIENRQRRIRRPDGSYVVSEYRYVSPDAACQERR